MNVILIKCGDPDGKIMTSLLVSQQAKQQHINTLKS